VVRRIPTVLRRTAASYRGDGLLNQHDYHRDHWPPPTPRQEAAAMRRVRWAYRAHRVIRWQVLAGLIAAVIGLVLGVAWSGGGR